MSAVRKRKVFLVAIRLVSPLNLSSGEDEWTDADVLRDFEGNPFIPGSSVAGAMRAYIEKEKDCPCLMGYAKHGNQDDQGKMSSLFISDVVFDSDVPSGIRDGVALDENKRSVDGSKYDMEILEAGAEGHFYLELVVRDGDNEEQMQSELETVFAGIQTGEIRLGSKKTRGFGKVEITSLKSEEFDKNNYDSYADAYKKDTWTKSKELVEDIPHYAEKGNKMIHLSVPLRIKGGISIRQYAAKKNEPDFAQLTDHDWVPVIPGSSFAGAVRHRIKQILNQLHRDETKIQTEEIMNMSFGCVNDEKSWSSNIIFSEAEIEGAKPLTMTRTGISRFESAAKEGALYREKTYVDGKVTLEVLIRKEKIDSDTQCMLGLMLIALKDLQNGFLPVGGQTAIGRGVFSSDGPIIMDGSEIDDEKCAGYIGCALKGLPEMEGK